MSPPGTERVPREASSRDAHARTEPSGRRALLVLGMHRSGTSALARVLSLCGATLPRTLMPPDHNNPRGYFESEIFYRLHDSLFEQAGTRWDDLSPLEEDWIDAPAGASWIERLGKVVQEEFGDSPLFVLKDPRLCRLVPVWLRVLDKIGVEPSFVILARHPLEVATSLHLAHHVPKTKTYLLWLQYFLSAEQATRDSRRSFATYASLLREWPSVMRRMSEDLELPLEPTTAAARAELEAFLSPELRHHDLDGSGIPGALGGWLKTVYRWTERAAAGSNPSLSTLDRTRKAFFGAREAFGPVLADAERESAHRGTELAGMMERVRTAEERRDESWIEAIVEHGVEPGPLQSRPGASVRSALDGADHDSIPHIVTVAIELARGHGREIQELTGRLEARAAEVEGLMGKLDSARAELAQREVELAGVRQESTERAQLAGRLAQDVERLESRLTQDVERLEKQLAAAREETARLGRLNDEHAREIDARTQELQATNLELDALGHRLQERDAVLADAGRLSAEQRLEIEAMRKELSRATAELSASLERSCADLADRDLYIAELRRRLDRVESSFAWRASRPLQAAAKLGAAILGKS